MTVSDVDRLLADLARWMGDERTADAVRSRRRETWLRQQAIEDANLVGLVLDLAERGQAVSVHTTTSRTYHGQIAAVATDFIVVSARAGGRVTLVALDALAVLRAIDEHAGEPMTSRHAAVDATMAAILAGLAGDRPHVQIVTLGLADPIVGELRAVGDDVATVVPAADPHRPVYVRLASVTECSVFGSG